MMVSADPQYLGEVEIDPLRRVYLGGMRLHARSDRYSVEEAADGIITLRPLVPAFVELRDVHTTVPRTPGLQPVAARSEAD